MSQGDHPTAADASRPGVAEIAPALQVAPSPHLSETSLTTRRMMIDVLIGLSPMLVAAIAVFRWFAVVQVGLCVLVCLATETLLTWMRRKPAPIGDYSAAITGVILGLSLPWSAPWYVAVIGSCVAIGIGKVAFGGLGCNIFNPAMVGRAFVMLSFAREMGASAYVVLRSDLAVLTQATPLTVAKEFAASAAAGKVVAGDLQTQLDSARQFWPLFLGQVNGSLGEISAVAVLVGGIYLCIRGSASWEIPAGVLLGALLTAVLAGWADLTPFTMIEHLASGSLLFGAFFIATDPVTSPLTAKGKFVFGLGIGMLVLVIRLFSGYPEGVMFAVLLMNAAAPLINRWTIPRPVGGPTPILWGSKP